MMDAVLTKHASDRMQQRGIPPVIVDWLLAFGSTREQHSATVHYFDRRSRKRLARYTGGLSSRIEHWLDVCLVLGRNNRVVTIFFRDQRVKGK